MEEVAPGIHRCGSALVNWYIVDEGGRLTIVDAGLPGYWKQLNPALAALGRTRADIAAVVLTHGDGDHVGFAERLRSEIGVPVMVHAGDERLARGTIKRPERGMLPLLGRPAVWRLLREFVRNGGVRVPGVRELSMFEGGAELDVPGRLRPIHTPGHTEGHCLLWTAAGGAVFVGDALCTLDPTTGRRGPRLMTRSFTVDSARARESLGRLEGLEGVFLPGHGDPWRGSGAELAEAARAARQS